MHMSSFQYNRYLTCTTFSFLFQVITMREAEVLPEKQQNYVSIFDLPANIFQQVRHYLTDHRLKAQDCEDFRDSLLAVMKLRATFSFISEVVNNSVLLLMYYITKDWLLPFKLTNFLDFMQRRTLWRFRFVQFSSEILSGEFDVIQMLMKNNILFSSSVRYLYFKATEGNLGVINDLTGWFKRVALKNKSDVEILPKLNCRNLSKFSETVHFEHFPTNIERG